MGAMASQIISLTIVYLTVYSGEDQSEYQSSALISVLLVTRHNLSQFPVAAGPIHEKYFNTMAADALASREVRASAVMALAMQDKWVPGFRKDRRLHHLHYFLSLL